MSIIIQRVIIILYVGVIHKFRLEAEASRPVPAEIPKEIETKNTTIVTLQQMPCKILS